MPSILFMRESFGNPGLFSRMLPVPSHSVSSMQLCFFGTHPSGEEYLLFRYFPSFFPLSRSLSSSRFPPPSRLFLLLWCGGHHRDDSSGFFSRLDLAFLVLLPVLTPNN